METAATLMKLPLVSLAGLRISTGVMFLIACSGKIRAGGAWPDRMVGFLRHNAEHAYGWYWQLVEAVIIPHQALVGYMVAYGELLLGLSLVLGAAVRFSASLGIFMVLNFVLVKGLGFWIPTSHDTLYLLLLAYFALVGGGRQFGLDGWIRARHGLPRWLG